MAPVLVIGLDPRKIAGFDPAPVELAIAMGRKRCVDAPQAAIAFNTNPMTSFEAAKRRMP